MITRNPLLLLLAAALWLTGCATTTTDLKRLRSDVRSQRNQLNAAESAAGAAKGYTGSIGKKSTARRVIVGKAAIDKILKAHMPYGFDGRKLSKRIKGSFTLSNVRGFKLLPRNRAQWTWDFKGKNVGVNLKGVPMASSKDARKAKEALTAGGSLTMEGSVWVDYKKNVLRLNGRCIKASLRRHNTSRHRGYVCDGANKKLFRNQQAVPLPKVLRGKKIRAMTTPNHLVLIQR